jgi:Domain of unknown function (DUF4350)
MIVGVIVGGIVVLNLLARGLDQAVGGNQPSGRPGSSYATTQDGLAAYATLLHEYGHPVSHQRGALARTSLPPSATLVALEPEGMTNDDSAALLRFVTSGGRLVIGGPAPFYLRSLRDNPPDWAAFGPSRYDDIDSSVGDVRRVDTAGRGSWQPSSTGSRRDLVRRDDAVLVTEEQVGTGTIVYVADTSPFENGWIAKSGDAAMTVALAGEDGRSVVFAEGVHGYGTSRGIRAIPSRWKIALLLLAVAAIAYIWSRARRLGPPDERSRELPPARAEYVDALATTLERTHDTRAALTGLQRWSRERIAARAGIKPDANDEELNRAARAYGCDEEERLALLAPPTDDASVIALGRVVARVAENER